MLIAMIGCMIDTVRAVTVGSVLLMFAPGLSARDAPAIAAADLAADWIATTVAPVPMADHFLAGAIDGVVTAVKDHLVTLPGLAARD